MILAMVVLAAASCRKEPSLSGRDGEYLVYTARDTETDLSAMQTFTIVDSALFIDGKDYERVLNDWVKDLKAQYKKAFADFGYTYVEYPEGGPAEGEKIADLGLQITYIISTDYFTSHVNYDPYWWWGYPGYWTPGYWGNWGRWHYSYPVTYSYSTHSLLTEMVDLTGKQGRNEKLNVVWNSYIDGHVGNSYNDRTRFSKAIKQSFAQSGYLDKSAGNK